ncbi:MAG: MFS transporter, partial [Bifidobacteriaceae bacterium]|nr:MFS transporter [Bifidobacteriaceae bacterium]
MTYLPVARARSDARRLRNATTYCIYLVTVNWAFIIYAVCASVPQLAADLGISKTVAGLHGTALWAAGLAVAAFLGPLAAHLGRRRAISMSLSVGAVACLALALGRTAATTLPAALVMAIAFNMAVAFSIAALVAQQGRSAPAATAEATACSAAVACAAPLSVGAAAALGWGWRPALGLAVPLALATAWLVARLPRSPELDSAHRAQPPGPLQPVPAGLAAQAPPGPAPGGRPRSARLFAALAALTAVAIMVEIGIIFWAAQFIVDQTGASVGAAASAVTAFAVGLTLGRLAAAPLAARYPPLLLAAIGLALLGAGWVAFWTATSLAVAAAALFAMGFGAGPGYPLGLSLALRHSPLPLDTSQGAMSAIGGGTGALVPFALGWLGAEVGVHAAYTLIPCLLAIGLAAAAVAGRLLGRSPSPARTGGGGGG